MAPQDWYRTGDWDDQTRADFEARLRRAREHNRPQYLRIKAGALWRAGNKAGAAELLTRVLDQYRDSLDAPAAAELLAGLAFESGDHEAAEAHYRESLLLSTDQNATSGEVHIGLAEVLVAQGRHEEAVSALESFPVDDLMLNHAVCRWNAVLAEAAHALGQQQAAAAAAARAVALLEAPDQFSRHRGVGRAVLTDEQAQRLRRLATSDAPAARSRLRWFRAGK